jgi:hypothetical protein
MTNDFPVRQSGWPRGSSCRGEKRKMENRVRREEREAEPIESTGQWSARQRGLAEP